MRGRGKLTSLFGAVAAVATLLLVASRWAGHAPGPPGEADGDAGSWSHSGPVRALTAPRVPDLSFYRTLGQKPPPRGEAADDLGRDQAPIADPGRPTVATVFVVQVMATRDRAQARRVRDHLAARGLPAAVSEARAGTRLIYRVRLGRYRDRSAAEAMIRRLRGERGLSPWILQETR